VREPDAPQRPPAAVIDAFTAAAITALQELTSLAAWPEATGSANDDPPLEPIVAATIRLRRAVPGTMTWVSSATTARGLAVRYLPAAMELSDELIDDVAGEFANVIAGQAKTMLKGTPYHFTLSPPVVTRSRSPDAADEPLAVALKTELGWVRLLLDLPPCPSA
jgi:CheY-specific phosphatase CheX